MNPSKHSSTSADTRRNLRPARRPGPWVIAALLALFTAPAAAQSVSVFPADQQGANARTIAAGTRYATPYYVNTGSAPGPTVVIVGGMHGNETAGYMAAERFTRTKPRRGTLVVIPRANRLGVEDNAREGRHPGDLNRDFPRSRGDEPDSELARSLWALIQQLKPDLLLDLHEGYDYHKRDPKSVGQTIIYYPKGDTYTIAQAMQEAVNARIDDPSTKFSLLKYPVKGSLARAVGQFTSGRAMIVETSRLDPLSVRIEHHVAMVRAALEKLDM